MEETIVSRKKVVITILIICIMLTSVLSGVGFGAPTVNASGINYSEKQWYLENAKITEAWNAISEYKQTRVSIAVIDSGINLSHQEFDGVINMQLAWDAINDKPLVGDSTGHGTRVAGIIAAKGIKMKGVAAGNVEIIPVCAVKSGYVSVSNKLGYVAKGFEYIEKIVKEGKAPNLKAINISMSYALGQLSYEADKGEEYNAILDRIHASISRLKNNYGIITIAAGGNDVYGWVPTSDYVIPSDYEEVFSVTATNSNNKHQISFCYNEHKDISAPGVSIFTTDASSRDSYTPLIGGKEYATGTSFATPIVTGVAALMWSIAPKMSANEVITILKRNATPLEKNFINISNEKEESVTNGSSGLINAKAAIDEVIAKYGIKKSAEDSKNNGNTSIIEIPSKYDGRDYGYLTPVKSQGKTNMCWAYATIAAIEADAVKNHGYGKDLDLSEYHLAYFTFADKSDPLGLINSDKIVFKDTSEDSNFINNGGNPNYPISTLTSGAGPVLEKTAPMSNLIYDAGALKPGAYNQSLDASLRNGNSILEVNNIYDYSLRNADWNKDTINLVKKGIMKHGAAVSSYYSPLKDCYNRTQRGVAYYQNVTDTPDHGIAIVGWDDNFPVEAFASANRPKNPGAWLVKNSWGSGSAYTDNGYFWLSYEDKVFSENVHAYIYDMRAANTYDYNYQYDGGIIHEYSSTQIEENATGYANVFTAQENSTLEAISVQIDRGYAESVSTLSIYTDVTDNPERGNLIHSEQIKTFGNGYFTIPLSKSLKIRKNQRFSVVIRYDNPEKVSYICTDRTYNPSGSAFASINHTEANQSFAFDKKANRWKDLNDERFYVAEWEHNTGTSLCIKAFMNRTGDVEDIEHPGNGDAGVLNSENTSTNKTDNNSGEDTDIEGGNTSNKDKEDTGNNTVTRGKIYKIKYVLNGGKNNKNNPSSYMYTTASFSLKKPTRKGYTFKGWYTDSKLKKKAKTTIQKGSIGNKTFYAKWTVNKYKISFNKNGATSGKMKTLSKRAYSKTYTLPGNTFKRAGYRFVGWNTRKDGKGKMYKNKAKVKKLTSKNGQTVTLYAQWKKK